MSAVLAKRGIDIAATAGLGRPGNPPDVLMAFFVLDGERKAYYGCRTGFEAGLALADNGDFDVRRAHQRRRTGSRSCGG